jgi:hypothetical protein
VSEHTPQVISVGRPSDRAVVSSRGLARAVAAPIAVAALAFVLWVISDHLLYVGPLDRATFGWAVVIPVWAAAPLTAGIAWVSLSASARRLAAAICALAIGGVAAVLFWQAAAFPACQYGAVRGPAEWLVPSIALGAVIGGGFSVSGLAAVTQVRAGRRWHALMIGAGTQVAVVFVAILFVVSLWAGGGCQRPPA